MKRILAIILSIAILVMAFPLSVFAAEPSVATDTWDGTTTEPTETDADGNIIINTAEEMAWLALVGGDQTVGKTYKVADGIHSFNMNGFVGITADSTATDVKNATTTGSEYAWYNDNPVFKGNFNGNGVTIYNIAGKKGAAYGGLFPNMICEKGSFSTIENVTVKASAFYGYHYTAGLLGNTNGQFTVDIKKCSIENCYLAYYSGDGGGNKIAASIVGMSQNVTVNITNCLTIDNIIESAASEYSLKICGGFIGNASTWAPSAFNITNSISIGTSPYPTVVESGAIGDDIVEAAWTNVYTDVACDKTGVVTLSTDMMQGEAAKTNMALAWGNDWLAGDTGEYPYINYGEPVIDPYLWDGEFTEPTETDSEGNIIINTAQEMAWVALRGGDATIGKNYKVADDVKYFNMNGMVGVTDTSTVAVVKAANKTGVTWSIGVDSTKPAFQGNFDGNGVTVFNIATVKYGYSGLFPVVLAPSGGTLTIKNVAVVASDIRGYHNAGGVVGLANAPDTSTSFVLENCMVKNCFISDGADANTACQRTAGTLVGGLSHNTTTISNCAAINNEISAQGAVGGFVSNCSNYGGGITISNSISVGTTAEPTAITTVIGSKIANTNYTNVYTDQVSTASGVTTFAAEDMSGYKATLKLETLDESNWFFIATTYPEPIVFHNVVDGVCTDCGLAEATDPCTNGHTLSAVDGIDATNFTNGLKAHDKCSLCGKTFIDGVEVTADELVIPMLAKTWNGTFVEPTETDSEGNIIINTPEELAWVALRGGSATQGNNYIVVKDAVFNLNGMVDITPYSTVADVKAATKNESFKWQFEVDNNRSAPFGGNFDGNGLIIYNLYSGKGRGAAGLFPVTLPVSNTTITIKNVTVMASHIGGYHYAGGIVGLADAPDTSTKLVIENSAVKNCYIYDNDDQNAACQRTTGTLVGNLSHNATTINNCIVVDNELSAQGIIGGLFGNTSQWGGANAVSNVISIGTTVKPIMVNYAINDKAVTYVNVYTDQSDFADGITILETSQMQGAAAKENMNLNWNVNWSAGAEGEYPSFIIDNSDFYDEWDGTFVEPIETDESGNIIINTAEEMAWVALRGDTATEGKNYKVADGIKYFNMNGMVGITLYSTAADVKAATKNEAMAWRYAADDKVGTFCGNFDGNGVTIYNIYTAKGRGYAALFPVVKPASRGTLTIKNVAVVASHIGAYHNAGAIIGNADAPDSSSSLVIDNCVVKNNYIFDNNDQNPATQRTVGAIAGNLTHNASTINNCLVVGNELSAQGILGGLFGNTSNYASPSTVSNVISIGTTIEPTSVNVTVSEKVANVAYTNVYTDQSTSIESIKTLSIAELSGKNAHDNTALDWTVWFGTTGLPELRIFHNITATDNGDGTHNEYCADCATAGLTTEHNFVAGECICGAEDDVTAVYGDVNGDGLINGRDYGMLMQYLNGWGTTINEANADVNGDGLINGRDYGMLMQYLNGWGVTLGPKA